MLRTCVSCLGVFCHTFTTYLNIGDKGQILIRTASFLQNFTVSENSLCMLFANDARRQLHNIFIQFGDNIQTARQLRNAVFSKFFDKS